MVVVSLVVVVAVGVWLGSRRETVTAVQQLHLSRAPTRCAPRGTDVYTPEDLFDHSIRACASVLVHMRDGTIKTGSGFVVDGGWHLVTAAHVVWSRGATVEVVLPSASGVYTSLDVSVVGIDLRGDVAVLRLPSRASDWLEFRPESEHTRTGERVAAIGDPYGVDPHSFSQGVVRDGQWKDPSGRLCLTGISTDVSTGPGSSGSPLLDRWGRVVGMHTNVFGVATDNGETSFGGGPVGWSVERIVRAIVAGDRLDENRFFRKRVLPRALQLAPSSPTALHGVEPLPTGVRPDFYRDAVTGRLLSGYVVRAVFDTGDGVLRTGDLVTHVDGQSVGLLHFDYAIADTLWHTTCTSVRLTVLRADGSGPIDVRVDLEPLSDGVDVPPTGSSQSNTAPYTNLGNVSSLVSIVDQLFVQNTPPMRYTFSTGGDIVTTDTKPMVYGELYDRLTDRISSPYAVQKRNQVLASNIRMRPSYSTQWTTMQDQFFVSAGWRGSDQGATLVVATAKDILGHRSLDVYQQFIYLSMLDMLCRAQTSFACGPVAGIPSIRDLEGVLASEDHNYMIEGFQLHCVVVPDMNKLGTINFMKPGQDEQVVNRVLETHSRAVDGWLSFFQNGMRARVATNGLPVDSRAGDRGFRFDEYGTLSQTQVESKVRFRFMDALDLFLIDNTVFSRRDDVTGTLDTFIGIINAMPRYERFVYTLTLYTCIQFNPSGKTELHTE